MATLDLVYEIERRGLFALPSIFTPLHDTRMEAQKGVAEARRLTPLQWQLMLKCWKMSLRPGLDNWWITMLWRVGAIAMWAFKLRRTNEPNFTWPIIMFSSALPENFLHRMGKVYIGKPLRYKTRKELIAGIRPNFWRYLWKDNGDLPEGYVPQPVTPAQQTTPLAS